MNYSASIIFLLNDGRYYNAILSGVRIDEQHLTHKGNIIGAYLESQVMRNSIVKTYYPNRHD